MTVVPPGGEAAFLAPLPPRAVSGVGPRTDARLAAAGIATIGDLAIGDLAGLGDGDLGRLLPGRVGEELRRRARGLDDRPVRSEPAERVSISTERTFDRDVSDPARLRALGGEMAARAAEALHRRGRFARTVTVKLRYADFRIVTRAETIEVPTDDAAAIARTAARLLGRALAERPGRCGCWA